MSFNHTTVKMNDYGMVVCPLCTQPNIHQMTPEVYNEHIVIPFNCEHCGPRSHRGAMVVVLHIVQNQGSTYMAWEPINNDNLDWDVGVIGELGYWKSKDAT